MRIDLNSGIGEDFATWAMGDDSETIYRKLITECGVDAPLCAHPHFHDRIVFGQRVILMNSVENGRQSAAQISTAPGIAAQAGALKNRPAHDQSSQINSFTRLLEH